MADQNLPYDAERIINRLAGENARLHDVIATLLEEKTKTHAEPETTPAVASDTA